MRRIAKHMSYANVAATLALVLALSGGALAATGALSSAGKLHACADHQGVLKLLKAGKKCRKGQSEISWNQTGPAGPKGASGAPGAPGAPGTAGAAGTSAVTVWAETNGSAKLVAGSGVTNVVGDSEGLFFTFNRDVSKCAISASLNEGPAVAVYAQHGEFANQIVTKTEVEEKAGKEEFAAGGVDLIVSC